MSSEAMSLKGRLKNLAKQKNISAQILLQNYMFEKLLERLSKSSYKDKFISISLLQNIPETLEAICKSKELQIMWQRYRKEYTYAADIEYSEIMVVLEKMMGQVIAKLT